MKKTLAFSFFMVSLYAAFAQKPGLPEVSRKVDFAGITVELDADAQKLVQKEVSSLLIPENKYVLDKLQRIQWYFPVIERILELEKVPDDFKYLAVVESSLLPDAISSSNAVGFWQMKASTAQEMGLRVDSDIDERKNIYSSTRAAAAYLKRNNQIYKNWISTLYSYMLGAGGISKIVPSEWTNASRVEFDGRTDRYLLKTIAARIAFEYRVNRMKDNAFGFVEYRKGRGKTLAQIASMIDVDATDLKKNNSWLQTNVIPDDYSVAILVPVTRLDEVQSKIGRQPDFVTSKVNKAKKEEIKHRDYPVLERVTMQVNNEEDPVFYTINEKKGILAKPGDDVASLARGGKLKIKDFLLFNDMSDRDAIEEGQVYYLQRKLKKGPIEKHQIQSGETMWGISQMFGIKLKNLLNLNRMRTSMPIQEGQIVYLQKKRPKTEPIENNNGVKEQEPDRKVPVVENYENETLVKDANAKKIPSPEVTMQNQGETVVIERTTKRQPQAKKEPVKETVSATTTSTTDEGDEDDIVVITEDEDKTDFTASTVPVKPAYSNPNVTIKDSPKTTEARKTVTAATPTALPKTGIHTVDVGQTLYSIARLYKVTVRDLAAWNGFTTNERVKVGQELIVSNRVKVADSPRANSVDKNNAKSEKEGGVATHQVVKGETLFSIAKRYKVAMKQIQEWNNMSDQNVKIGQKLIIRKI
ncbi:LysM peptidoglycan-binding domain-containing protein [Emticicia sp. BO119]|uniref:LysM peptidoglycan-binding domain-containing protein n=1 Tax=Emticicia sp. BO119 TaxID=2757768 RepID=UPI0015F0822C|nr:LysM peptidoglycan-binding domain-containing protein [Emticicia sp. BO119]MBA4849240.1 LysM peptidoglycan-binding domain-containing protein [Emticicia sp. BO119]